MGADWNRSGLREMDRHDRYARQVRQAAQSALHSKEFDHSQPGRRTSKAAIHWNSLSSPDENRIQVTVQKYVRAGWEYVARKEDLSLWL